MKKSSQKFVLSLYIVIDVLTTNICVLKKLTIVKEIDFNRFVPIIFQQISTCHDLIECT
jgi:hypothetical protein